jgi:hypothetical protein
MAFYGDKSKAESMAGTGDGSVTQEMQDAVNQWIDTNIKDGFGLVEDADEYYDIKKLGQTELVLKNFPISEVTELYDLARYNEPVLIDPSNYSVDKDSGILQLIKSNYLMRQGDNAHFSVGTRAVRVKYKYGFNEVPGDIKQIATLMAAKWAKIKSQQTDMDGLKSVKMANYSESYDLEFMNIKSEYDEILGGLINNAIKIYAIGV